MLYDPNLVCGPLHRTLESGRWARQRTCCQSFWKRRSAKTVGGFSHRFSRHISTVWRVTGSPAQQKNAIWWFGTWLRFSHILGIIIPIDFHIFQRGWNHQPDRFLFGESIEVARCRCHFFQIFRLRMDPSLQVSAVPESQRLSFVCFDGAFRGETWEHPVSRAGPCFLLDGLTWFPMDPNTEKVQLTP